MARIAFMLGILMFVITLGATHAYAGSGTGGGHSFEWFRDADGDGIPNGMDDDWSPPEDGTGYQVRDFFGPSGIGTFWGNVVGGAADGKQCRHRKNQPDASGDCLRIHLHLRDGSCE